MLNQENKMTSNNSSSGKNKITWKILLLITVVVFSVIGIFNAPIETKLALVAIFSVFVASFFFKSKPIRTASLVLLILGVIFLIYSSITLTGVTISGIETNTTAFKQGLRQGYTITNINGQELSDTNEYATIILENFPSEENKKITIQTKENGEFILFTNTAPNITIKDISKTKVKMGLDLVGGSRALVRAENRSLDSNDVRDLVAVLENRLNVYGLSDVNIRPVTDLSGNHFVLVEIAGATPDDLKSLISEQGKFEARVGNQTVFSGGDKDISSVGRNAQNSRIESCQQTEQGYACRFSFSVFLSQSAAERHASITQNLSINETNPEYLDKKLDLYLDNRLVDSLFIGKDLKGRVTTQISISGSGNGETRDVAYENAEEEMSQLQTVLITGSLPYKLEIAKLDTISPRLGNEFLQSIFFAAGAAILAVAIIVFFRYKRFKASLALLLTSASEILIILGVASVIGWNIDLPSIAGILATIGTGIDQQIIIIDEAKSSRNLSIKQRLKRAFSIILGAYFTAVVAMLPLMWAGAGLLKGFAVTTIIGISVGVLITRPAFTDMVGAIEE